MAPLSAALANSDDTHCYSVAAADAALAAALLAYYTSSQVDTLLGDYRTGTAQDTETTSAITAALLAYYTSSQVDALLGDYRTGAAQDTQTQAAITGALLAYRPDQDVFTTNQITSALAAYRSAADQDTATASSIAAALLSYYTIAQPCGQARSHRGSFPDDGGADEVVAAIGEQILAPTDVSLSNWTVRPSSGCSVVLATHTAGVSVDGYTLTLAETLCAPTTSCSSPAATGSARPPTSWCTCQRPTTSTTHCTAASWATRALGARPRCTSQCRQTELEPTLTSQSSVASASFALGGFQLEGYAMTLSAFVWNIVRTYTLTPGRCCSFGCRHRLGTASNLVMYVSAADNDYVGVTGPRRASGARHVWTSQCRRAELRSCTSEPSAGLSPGWCSSRRARWTCTACRSGPAPSRETRKRTCWRTRWPSRARPRWTASPRRATWAATSCCATT